MPSWGVWVLSAIYGFPHLQCPHVLTVNTLPLVVQSTVNQVPLVKNYNSMEKHSKHISMGVMHQKIKLHP